MEVWEWRLSWRREVRGVDCSLSFGDEAYDRMVTDWEEYGLHRFSLERFAS